METTGTQTSPILSVLIIEDQADIATSLRMYLELAAGHKVIVALDGEAGVAAAINNSPDVVVCDIGLPKKNGFEVAREISRMACKPLLIACTAYCDEAMKEKGKAAGFDYYLCKPADPIQIVQMLDAHKKKLMAS